MTAPDHLPATPETAGSPADGPPLPEMREAVLTEADVAALVADLQEYTQITGTICKTRSQQQAPAGNTPLAEAVDRLLARTVTAVQVRYRYDGREWTDTLMQTPAGIRLVRCQHADAGSTAQPGPA